MRRLLMCKATNNGEPVTCPFTHVTMSSDRILPEFLNYAWFGYPLAIQFDFPGADGKSVSMRRPEPCVVDPGTKVFKVHACQMDQLPPPERERDRDVTRFQASRMAFYWAHTAWSRRVDTGRRPPPPQVLSPAAWHGSGLWARGFRALGSMSNHGHFVLTTSLI